MRYANLNHSSVNRYFTTSSRIKLEADNVLVSLLGYGLIKRFQNLDDETYIPHIDAICTPNIGLKIYQVLAPINTPYR
jgi:hypothetical protein